MLRGDFLVRLVFTSLKLNFNGEGYSEGGQGASFPGGYWGLLGALTSFAYWGALSAFHYSPLLALTRPYGPLLALKNEFLILNF